MKEIDAYKHIGTYEITTAFFHGFYVDIVTEGKTYTAWLYHKDYGIKELMFGCGVKTTDIDTFIIMVDKNAHTYIPTYIENRLEEDH